MLYHDPKTIYSPKDFIEEVSVLYDGGEESFSLAKIVWEGTECIGLRWNVARREWDDVEKNEERKICVGMPSSHGYPAWFILPVDLAERIQDQNLPTIESLLEALKDTENSVIQLLVGPGQGIGAINTTRRTGLQEIRAFTKEAIELTVIDPYIFSAPGNTIGDYIEEFKKSSRIDGRTLKRLHFIYNPNNVTNSLKGGIKRLASDNNCNISSFATDKIHDRIWIKNKTEAIMIGTSFGGVGNKLCFITRVEEGDLQDLLKFMETEKMLTGNFI